MLQSSLWNSRFTPSIALAMALVAALSLQHVFGWLPCPLCIVQRVTAIGMLAALVAFGWARTDLARTGLIALAALAAGVGVLAGGAHLYLIYGPQSETCGPGLALTVAQLVDAIPGSQWLLEGAGACGDTRYAIFGLPLPGWSVLAHVIPLALAARLYIRQ